MQFFREKKIGPDPRWKYKTVERNKDQENEQKYSQIKINMITQKSNNIWQDLKYIQKLKFNGILILKGSCSKW